MDSVSDNDKVFFTEALILWIYEYRKNEPKREVFKHAILIEEAHHLLSNQKENLDGGETIIETSLQADKGIRGGCHRNRPGAG